MTGVYYEPLMIGQYHIVQQSHLHERLQMDQSGVLTVNFPTHMNYNS